MGTDGRGARNLIVAAGAARTGEARPTLVAEAEASGVESEDGPGAEHLYMDGQELFRFTLQRVPQIVRRTLERGGVTRDDVRWWVFHQANAFMNAHLRSKLGIAPDRAPVQLADVGNTVSSTIPITLHRSGHDFAAGHRVMLVGFGVGYSWGAVMLDWGDVRLV